MPIGLDVGASYCWYLTLGLHEAMLKLDCLVEDGTWFSFSWFQDVLTMGSVHVLYSTYQSYGMFFYPCFGFSLPVGIGKEL